MRERDDIRPISYRCSDGWSASSRAADQKAAGRDGRAEHIWFNLVRIQVNTSLSLTHTHTLHNNTSHDTICMTKKQNGSHISFDSTPSQRHADLHHPDSHQTGALGISIRPQTYEVTVAKLDDFTVLASRTPICTSSVSG